MEPYPDLLARARAGQIVAVIFYGEHVYNGAYVPGDDHHSREVMRLAHHEDSNVRAGLLIQMACGIREHLDRD